jgi:hypothetical protein
MPTPLRAAMLASWGTAYLLGAEPLERAVAAVEGDDEPHLVVSDPLGGPDELAEALVAMRAERLAGLRLALPVPGDLVGLAGPPSFNQAVLAVGEAAIGIADPARAGGASVPALIPDVCTFGAPGDQGHCVTWRSSPASGATPDVPTLPEADRGLTEAMRDAAVSLARVTSGSWTPGAADIAQRLRSWGGSLLLPEVAGPRAEALAQRAVHTLAIVEAARDDSGGALTSHSAQIRSASLTPLERAARRGLVAAVGACHDLAVH